MFTGPWERVFDYFADKQASNNKKSPHLQAGMLQGCCSWPGKTVLTSKPGCCEGAARELTRKKEKFLTYKHGCCTGVHIFSPPILSLLGVHQNFQHPLIFFPDVLHPNTTGSQGPWMFEYHNHTHPSLPLECIKGRMRVLILSGMGGGVFWGVVSWRFPEKVRESIIIIIIIFFFFWGGGGNCQWYNQYPRYGVFSFFPI